MDYDMLGMDAVDGIQVKIRDVSFTIAHQVIL